MDRTKIMGNWIEWGGYTTSLLGQAFLGLPLHCMQKNTYQRIQQLFVDKIAKFGSPVTNIAVFMKLDVRGCKLTETSVFTLHTDHRHVISSYIVVRLFVYKQSSIKTITFVSFCSSSLLSHSTDFHSQLYTLVSVSFGEGKILTIHFLLIY